MYTEKVMEHFRNPKNVGEMPDADGIGEVGNMQCGDIMWIYIKVIDDRIQDIKFKTLGCAAAIATSSVTTELVKGKTLEEALKTTNHDIVNSIGGLPAPKIHCSLLAVDGLKEAVYDYLKKSNRHIPDELEKRHDALAGENHGVCCSYN